MQTEVRPDTQREACVVGFHRVVRWRVGGWPSRGNERVPEEGVSRAEEGVGGVDRGALMNQFKCMR